MAEGFGANAGQYDRARPSIRGPWSTGSSPPAPGAACSTWAAGPHRGPAVRGGGSPGPRHRPGRANGRRGPPAGLRSRWPGSRTGTRRAANSTRWWPGRPGTGSTRRPGPARRGADPEDGWPCSGTVSGPHRDGRRHGRGHGPGDTGCADAGSARADRYARLGDRAASGVRETGAFVKNIEQWRFDWERPYSRDEWLDAVPTFGGSDRLRTARSGSPGRIGAVTDAIGGQFTMGYTTVVTTAGRSAN